MGLVDPEARVFCPGHATFYGREFHCHKKGGHGWVNLRDAIKMSCDVYFYNLGRRLGIDRISEIATSFGFGQPTGIDLSFEKSGLVPSEEWAQNRRGARWYPSETISVAIGQGPLLVTSMQVARALSGLVEDGRLPTPHLFYSSQDPRTGEQLRYKAEFREAMHLPKEKLDIVKNGMWAVVNEPGGTAYGSRANGVEMGGKTGTVQVVGRESTIRAGADRARLQDHAWFAGFGPVDDPPDGRRGLRRARRPRQPRGGAARQGALRGALRDGARASGLSLRAVVRLPRPRVSRRPASGRRHDLAGDSGLAPDRPRRAGLRPGARRARRPLHRLRDDGDAVRGARRQAGDPGSASGSPP